MLRKRYAAPEWALLEEVRSETGVGGPGRSADALAMCTWPSRGLEILGFEIKVTRQDWLKELKDPEKSAAIQKYCDRWWVVAGNKNIVKPGELPPTWGLMIATRSRVIISVDAPKLAPEALDRAFVASLFRNVFGVTDSAEKNNESYQKGFVAGRLDYEQQLPWEQKNLKHQHDQLQRAVTEFQQKTGLSINSWDYGGLGEALKLIREAAFGPKSVTEALLQSAEPLRQLLVYMDAIRKIVELKDAGQLERRS